MGAEKEGGNPHAGKSQKPQQQQQQNAKKGGSWKDGKPPKKFEGQPANKPPKQQQQQFGEKAKKTGKQSGEKGEDAPAGKGSLKKLGFGDSDEEDDGEIKINQKFAKQYEERKKNQELSQCQNTFFLLLSKILFIVVFELFLAFPFGSSEQHVWF